MSPVLSFWQLIAQNRSFVHRALDQEIVSVIVLLLFLFSAAWWRWRPCRWFPWLCCLFSQPALKSWSSASVPSLPSRPTSMQPRWILHITCRHHWVTANTKYLAHAHFFKVFNLALSLQYIGRWYEIQKLPTAFQKGECGTATYSLKSPGVIGVLNRELLWVSGVIRFVGLISAATTAHILSLSRSLNNNFLSKWSLLSAQCCLLLVPIRSNTAHIFNFYAQGVFNIFISLFRPHEWTGSEWSFILYLIYEIRTIWEKMEAIHLNSKHLYI